MSQFYDLKLWICQQILFVRFNDLLIELLLERGPIWTELHSNFWNSVEFVIDKIRIMRDPVALQETWQISGNPESQEECVKSTTANYAESQDEHIEYFLLNLKIDYHNFELYYLKCEGHFEKQDETSNFFLIRFDFSVSV